MDDDRILILAFCTLILVLLIVVWHNSKLKLENTKLKFTNEFLQQSGERQYVPDGYR